jgi:hypothetical protein
MYMAIKVLFGSRPKLAMPQCAPPQNSNMSVAVEMLATCCGEPDLGVAMCGGRPNSPNSSNPHRWSISCALFGERLQWHTVLASVRARPGKEASCQCNYASAHTSHMEETRKVASPLAGTTLTFSSCSGALHLFCTSPICTLPRWQNKSRAAHERDPSF